MPVTTNEKSASLPMGLGEEPPALREELDRKTLEVLDRLIRHRSLGKISDDECRVAFQAVWELVSGLVTDDVSAAATDVHKEVSKLARGRQTRVFREIETGKFACSLTWTPGACSVQVLRANGKGETLAWDTELEARKRFMLTADRLTKNYQEWK